MSAIPSLQGERPQLPVALEAASISLHSVSFPLVIHPPRRLSDQELLLFCAANEPLRIEHTAQGDLVVMTPAGGKTGNKEGYLFRELDLWVEREGKGIAFNSNTGFLLPDGSMRVPDAAWLSDEKWRALTGKQQDGFVPACPEFVVELRSPSDRASQVEERMEFWIDKGALSGWLIDPQRQMAMIYRPAVEPETLLKPEFLEGEGPVAGFRLKMQRFWE
jgi:Uma2 family endonuclease